MEETTRHYSWICCRGWCPSQTNSACGLERRSPFVLSRQRGARHGYLSTWPWHLRRLGTIQITKTHGGRCAPEGIARLGWVIWDGTFEDGSLSKGFLSCVFVLVQFFTSYPSTYPSSVF